MQIKFTGIYQKSLVDSKPNGWGVYLFYDGEEDETVKITGVITCALIEGAAYHIIGNEKYSRRYGDQIELQDIAIADDPTVMLMEEYIDGVGKKTARQLYDYFGPTCLQVVIDDPSAVAQCPGIRNKQKIMKSLANGIESEEIKLWLQIVSFFHCHISNHQVKKIIAYCQHEELENLEFDNYLDTPEMRWREIRANPYKLIDVIPSFGFKRADTLALQAGVKWNDENRIRAAILYHLTNITTATGNVCLPAEVICKKAAYSIAPPKCIVDPERQLKLAKAIIHSYNYKIETQEERSFVENVRTVWRVLTEMAEENEQKDIYDRKIVQYGDDFYLGRDYYYECFCTNFITQLCERMTSNDYCSMPIDEYYDISDIPYTEEQKAGIYKALNNHISILTGGPGTGKSSVLKAVIEIANSSSVVMLAPTGKAAERMSDVTEGENAMTIHRFWSLIDNGRIDEPEHQLIIVDEISMVGLSLLYKLLSHIGSTCDLFLVGDVNQLPSIDKGKVLEDLIKYGQIPVTYLTKCLRSNSSIDRNAELVLNRYPEAAYVKDNQSKWITIPENVSPKQVRDSVIRKYRALARTYGIDQTCVLVPFRRSQSPYIVTSRDINLAVHEMHDDPTTSKNAKWKRGDRVIVQHNCYKLETYEGTDEEMGIFNGDTGTIVDKSGETIKIDFDNGKTAWLTYEEMDENVDYGYAMTIHKSQGSEYDAVILLAEQLGQFVTRKMLYTAISRPRKKLIVMARKNVVDQIVNNDFGKIRRTHLMEDLPFV